MISLEHLVFLEDVLADALAGFRDRLVELAGCLAEFVRQGGEAALGLVVFLAQLDQLTLDVLDMAPEGVDFLVLGRVVRREAAHGFGRFLELRLEGGVFGEECLHFAGFGILEDEGQLVALGHQFVPLRLEGGDFGVRLLVRGLEFRVAGIVGRDRVVGDVQLALEAGDLALEGARVGIGSALGEAALGLAEAGGEVFLGAAGPVEEFLRFLQVGALEFEFVEEALAVGGDRVEALVPSLRRRGRAGGAAVVAGKAGEVLLGGLGSAAEGESSGSWAMMRAKALRISLRR